MIAQRKMSSRKKRIELKRPLKLNQAPRKLLAPDIGEGQDIMRKCRAVGELHPFLGGIESCIEACLQVVGAFEIVVPQMAQAEPCPCVPIAAIDRDRLLEQAAGF